MALGSLTAEFGMGSGTGSPLIPPGRPKTDDGHRKAADRSRSIPRGRNDVHCKLVIHLSSIRRHSTSVLRRLSTVIRCALKMSAIKFKRAISTGKLNALPRLHTRPINVVVYHGSSGRTRFEVGFPLRCFQRLSRPHIATQHCGWRHNCSTRGAFISVLSY